MAASVVVPVGEIADELVDRLVQAAGELKIGNGLDEDVFLGPVIRASHKERTVARYIETGAQEGAIYGPGRSRGRGGSRHGVFCRTDHSRPRQTGHEGMADEIFAPVLSIVRANDFDEAIAIANQSDFANGACIFGQRQVDS